MWYVFLKKWIEKLRNVCYEAREKIDNKIIKFLPLWRWLLNLK
ncbi:MAG: hypothetical protein AB1630_07485 [bacterium]